MAKLYIIPCTFCKFTITCSEIGEKARQLFAAHIACHAEQCIADIESYLEDLEEDE